MSAYLRIMLVLVGAVGISLSAAAQNLLFSSGFEQDVYLDPECEDDGYSCYQWILGTDLETGFTWPIEVLGGTGRLHLIGHDNHTALENEIQNVVGYDGQPTRALYMVQHHASPVGNIGQCPFSILDIVDGTAELYIRYRIKINADYVTNIDGRGAWRAIFEWKSEDYHLGDGFRLIAFIYLDSESDTPYWHWQGDADPQTPIWEIDNHDVPVPIGEWFETEFYWRWSEGADGRALWRVNGQEVGDWYGPTTRNAKPVDFIMLTQLYGSAEDGTVFPKHQWIDDVQIWDCLPTETAVAPIKPGTRGFDIFPNPSSGDFVVRVPSGKKSRYFADGFQIFSLSGALVGVIDAADIGRQWRSDGLAAGVYFVRPAGPVFTAARKVVILR